MGRIRPMDRNAGLRGATRDCANGRHPVWRESLQRGCLLASGPVRDRMVRGRATGALLQRGRVHSEVGTELGNPALSLGRDAEPQPRLVAEARRRRAQSLSHLSDRSRHGVLPHLRLPVAARAE